MSVSSYFTPYFDDPANLSPDNQFRLLTSTAPNLSRAIGTMVSGSAPNLATLTVACPGILSSSTVVITGLIGTNNFAGTLSVAITPGISFTLNSTSASDVGVDFCYYVVG